MAKRNGEGSSMEGDGTGESASGKEESITKRTNDDEPERKKRQQLETKLVRFEVNNPTSVEEIQDQISVALPVRYDKKFFQRILDKEISSIESRLEENNELIGHVCYAKDDESGRIYIYSFVIDAKYRGEGHGRALMKKLLERCAEQPIFLHVHTANIGAIRFYKYFGFKEESIQRRFYKRLNPPDALVLCNKTSNNIKNDKCTGIEG